MCDAVPSTAPTAMRQGAQDNALVNAPTAMRQGPCERSQEHRCPHSGEHPREMRGCFDVRERTRVREVTSHSHARPSIIPVSRPVRHALCGEACLCGTGMRPVNVRTPVTVLVERHRRELGHSAPCPLVRPLCHSKLARFLMRPNVDETAESRLRLAIRNTHRRRRSGDHTTRT